ncbi:D-Ala-D-Ala carboxypeptidase family metallohydrolase [Qipengyuania sp. JC766]|uniref:D-Ala-D-Ala carboxypeptidase family metallohydrolase n=1 Tax=Qipengyuania sp. JC766 TaxID=3232139 RepID=UPI00345B198B
MLRRLATFVAAVALVGGVALVLVDRGLLPVAMRIPVSAVAPDSEAAFERWLAKEPERAPQFRKLQGFLQAQGVGQIVPAWQLTRVDAYYAAECGIEPFALPPEDLWPNVVPALRLVRDEVIPAVGPVEVRSSYRTPELNVRAGGAGGSRHLDFAAVDLGTQDRQRGEALYRTLCAMHESAGAGSRMGLGAYYDPDEPGYAGGRFHVDASGYRSWGRGYTRASSPCRSFD